jgi:hypothetical protein
MVSAWYPGPSPVNWGLLAGGLLRDAEFRRSTQLPVSTWDAPGEVRSAASQEGYGTCFAPRIPRLSEHLRLRPEASRSDSLREKPCVESRRMQTALENGNVEE